MSSSSRQPDTLHAQRLANWLALLALLAAGIVWAPADGATPRAGGTSAAAPAPGVR
ncbi:MAG TPA: hypothetical protein VG011_10440 [Steroidobacteraceae bacterium]|nr:hypothetical protein [Steroidobacteraceae bacterium]